MAFNTKRKFETQNFEYYFKTFTTLVNAEIRLIAFHFRFFVATACAHELVHDTQYKCMHILIHICVYIYTHTNTTVLCDHHHGDCQQNLFSTISELNMTTELSPAEGRKSLEIAANDVHIMKNQY